MSVKNSILVFICLGSLQLYAQKGKETLVPLQSNPNLERVYEQEQSNRFSTMAVEYAKSTSKGTRFPFIDRFENPTGELSDSLWALKDGKVADGAAVLNAQNQNNITYSGGDGSYGELDILLSRDMDITGSNGQFFISFLYSTGSTWEANDSLVLELEYGAGNFVPVWTSANQVKLNEKVILTVDVQLLNGAAFNFRFKDYGKRLATNTQHFLLHQINIADKITTPYSEQFKTSLEGYPFQPSSVYWELAQADILDGYLLNGMKCARFNAFDSSGNKYTNGGFGDTLLSQLINLSLYPASDSLFLSFVYKAQPSSDGTDSLVLEFQNNLGVWIRVWQVGGGAANATIFSRQINIGRFRSSTFQFRLVNKSNYSNEDTLQFVATGFSIGKKLVMPFVDDFSSVKTYPSASKWTDKDVYINNDFAVNPPSVNVATFDGLDSRGNAYGQGSGYLDTLTSEHIHLNGLTRSDSVYLSFFVEPKGLGDVPNPSDSFVLEFRNNPFDLNSWSIMWVGLSPAFSNSTFTPIYILIDSAFLHHDFQFRFRNYGSKTGNIDNWHLDYVRLERGRSNIDGYSDFALTSNPTSLLTKYASMPRQHFVVNPILYTSTTQQIGLSNNDTTAFPLNYGRNVFNPEGVSINTFANTQPNVAAKSIVTVPIVSNPLLLTTGLTADSLVFTARYFVNQNNNFDNIGSNDSIYKETIFSNYFAYDDGTAEAGYGIEVEPGGVALGYDLAVPDMLHGVSMFFNQSFTDVSTKSFTVTVWSALGTNGDGTGGTVLKQVLQSRPTYTNQINGFHYLQFNPPVALPAGKFYIGWEQSEVFQLNMGFDRNFQINGVSAKNPEMWYHVKDGIWGVTQFNGALMMRPIIGKWLTPPVGMVEVEQSRNTFEVVVYPNPATDIVYINTNTQNDVNIEILDIAGRVVANNVNNQKNIPLSNITDGVYFVKVVDAVTGNVQVKKLIIN